jgi:hypothetical protein
VVIIVTAVVNIYNRERDWSIVNVIILPQLGHIARLNVVVIIFPQLGHIARLNVVARSSVVANETAQFVQAIRLSFHWATALDRALTFNQAISPNEHVHD